MPDMCIVCKSKNNKGLWVCCDNCNGWAHKVCTYLKNVSDQCIKDIPYHCDYCAVKLHCVMKENHDMKDTIDVMRGMMEEMSSNICQMADDMKILKDELTSSAKESKRENSNLQSWMGTMQQELAEIKGEIIEIKKKEKSEELKNKIELVTSEIKNVANNMEEKKTKATYADSLKSKKMLIVKATEHGKKAAEKKKEIMGRLKTPVEAVKETKDGHLAVTFTSKQNLEEAMEELEKDEENKITINEKGKMKPKIKLTNVSKDDEDVIQSIIMKNKWIADLIETEDDLIVKKEEVARDKKKKHYIIKCTPKIRKAIYDHNDKVYTRYENCNIYDIYLPYQCYKCQNFGHSATNCTNEQICPKCGGKHKYNQCNTEQAKCTNCEKRGLPSVDHKTFDRKTCAVYIEEIARVKNNTDHGFD